MQSNEHIRNKESKRTPLLKELLKDAFRPGTITVLRGVPGTGKTSLLIDSLICEDASGHRCLVILSRKSFETFSNHVKEMNEGKLLSERVIYRRPFSLLDESFGPIEKEITEQLWDIIFIDSGTDLIKKSQNERKAEHELGRIMENAAESGATVLVVQEDSQKEIFQALEFMADNVVEVIAESSPTGHFDRYLRVEKSCKGSVLGEYVLLLETADKKPYLINLESKPIMNVEEEEKKTTILKPEPVPTGISGLDEMLGPKLDSGSFIGFGRGTNVLITGAPGTRKTLLGLFFLASGSDEPKLLVSTKEEKVNFFRAQVPSLNKGLRTLTEVFYDAGHAHLSKLYELVKADIDNGKSYKRVVINAVSDFAQMSAGCRHFEDVLFKILYILNRAGATVLLIADTSTLNSQKVLNEAKLLSFVDTHVEISRAVVAYIEHVTLRIVKHWGIDYDTQIKELVLENEKLCVKSSFQMFVGLRNGEPRLLDVSLKLIAENNAERSFNELLTKECEFLVGSKERVRVDHYSTSEIVDIFEACMTSLPFLRSSATIAMVDEPWIRLVINQRKEELVRLRNEGNIEVQELREEYFPWLIENCTCSGNDDKTIYALPLYSDAGLFCVNRSFVDTNTAISDWETVKEKAKEAQKKGAQYGFLFNVFPPDTVASFMLELIWGFDASCLWEGRFNIKACSRALGFLQEMVFKEKLTPCYSELCSLCQSQNNDDSANTMQGRLSELMQKSAFFRTWYSQLVYLNEIVQAKKKKIELSITTLPTAETKGEAHSVLGPWYIVGFAGPAPQAVATLVKELCSKEKERRRFLTGSGLPVRTEVAKQFEYHRVKYTDLHFQQMKTSLLDKGRCRSAFGDFAALRDVLFDSAIVMMDDKKAKPSEFAEMIGSVFEKKCKRKPVGKM
jgi:KaiC/GvpD/RAD55 family RecA-like ATPase